MTDQTETTGAIVVPDSIDEEGAAEFIRKCIFERGGDPDTAYLISIDEPDMIPCDQTVRVIFRYTWFKSDVTNA